MVGYGMRRKWGAVLVGAAMAAVVVPGVPGVPGAGVVPAAAQAVDQAPTSSVALVADPAGTDHVLYRGQDGAVYLRAFDGGTWLGQSAVGGRIVGAPAGAAGPGTLVVAGRGTDNALWLRTRTNGTWGAWQSIGGAISSAPAVALGADGRLDVFARAGVDDNVYTRSRSAAGVWSAWTRLRSEEHTSELQSPCKLG